MSLLAAMTSDQPREGPAPLLEAQDAWKTSVESVDALLTAFQKAEKFLHQSTFKEKISDINRVMLILMNTQPIAPLPDSPTSETRKELQTNTLSEQDSEEPSGLMAVASMVDIFKNY
jgi:hypothetical protein